MGVVRRRCAVGVGTVLVHLAHPGEVIEVAPQYENAVHVTHYGWMAVVFAVAAVLVYIAGLMCSHLAAFRIATNLRLAMTKHIATLPLGAIEQFGSGKLRRTISETAGATETYLAHQLPDKAKAMATIAGLLALLLIFDWRLGLLSLVPVALAFAVMSSMTGKKLQDKMTQYQNALADMSNEAVEYVRVFPWSRPSDRRYSLSRSSRERSTIMSDGSLPIRNSCAGP